MKQKRNIILVLMLFLLVLGFAILQSGNKKRDLQGEVMLEYQSKQKGEMRDTYEVDRRHPYIESEIKKPSISTNNNKDNVIASDGNVKPPSTERKEQAVETIKNIRDKDPDKLYRERRNRLLEVCSRPHYNLKSPQAALSRNIIDRRQNFAYCTIQKTASTFWKRVFRIVIGESQASSPFDPSVKALQHFDNLRDIPQRSRESFMKKSLTFLFVRDPYSRLFSGYVDKLFSPNYVFWAAYGTFGIQHTRTNLSGHYLKSGHELSFREFVKTVIYAEKHNTYRDGHFTPQYEHCDPCQYKYDVIGKLETLAQDTFHLLKRIGKYALMRSVVHRLSENTLEDTIKDQVNMLFRFRSKYHLCGVTFYEAQKLMWKKFQIRGILSKHSKYPVAKEASERVTISEFSRMVYLGRGDAANRDISKANKEEAILEAFSTVDKEDMEMLNEMFRHDCELFGYDCRPDKLFKINHVIKPWFFDSSTA